MIYGLSYEAVADDLKWLWVLFLLLQVFSNVLSHTIVYISARMLILTNRKSWWAVAEMVQYTEWLQHVTNWKSCVYQWALLLMTSLG